MSKEISIVIRAKNAMAAGIADAGAALKSFGQSALRIGKAFAASFTAAGAAIGGFAVKALSSYAEQEKAEAALTASLNAYGETAAGIVPKLKKVAAAIQDETGAADESTLAGMAKLKMLGVQTSKLEEAAKATIALTSVGLKGESAQRAVALAMQGNYDMLNRYIPAIRNATSEQEKAAAFNDLVSRGYEQQKDVLNTTSGAWNALKGRVGDAWEETGKVIEQNSSLTTVLQKVGDEVKELTQSFSDWAANGGMVDVVAGIKVFAAEAIYRFKSVEMGFQLIWSVAKDATMTGVNYVVNVVKAWANAMVEQFKYVSAYAGAVWDKIKSPGTEFKPPDMSAYKEAMKEYGSALIGTNALVKENTEKTLAEMGRMHHEHVGELERLEKEHLAAKEEFARKRAEAEKKQLEAVAQAEKEAAEEAARQAEEAAEALRLKEEEIAKEKEKAAKITEEEGNNREESAKEVLKTEKEIAREKQRALTAEAKARGAKWRQDDPWGKVIDPWDELKKKPGDIPAELIPELPTNPGVGGDAGRGVADPWSIKLDAIRNEVKQLRGDLTGGG